MVQILDQDDEPYFHDYWSEFMRCDFKSTLFVDRAFLEEQGMFEDVAQSLAATGWGSFAHLSCETNETDTCEFLASVEAPTETSVKYRHRGVWYLAEPQDLRAAFGFLRAPQGERDTHSNLELWSELTGGESYISGKCNATSIMDPKLFYLQKVMARSITGRKAGTHKPSVADMEILRGLHYGRRVPYGHIMIHHWVNLRPPTDIYVGGLVTHYLRRTHGAETLSHHRTLSPEFLTRDMLRRMKAVRLHRTRGIEWSYRRVVAEDDEDQPPEPQQPQRRLRRCTQSGGPSRALAGPAFGADELTWMFNASRVFDYMAPSGASIDVPPPSGWQPGHPVPPEYRMFDLDEGGPSRAQEEQSGSEEADTDSSSDD